MAAGSERPFWRELIETVVVAFIIAKLLMAFVVQTTIVDGPSMEPTLQNRERLVLEKLSYRFHPPRRGDIIVFAYPLNEKKDYVKRVVGLPGEKVAMVDGVVYINGQPWRETHPLYPDHYNMAPVLVPPGKVFVLGDNRGDSEDSRIFGFVDFREIRGHVMFILWPPAAISRL